MIFLSLPVLNILILVCHFHQIGSVKVRSIQPSEEPTSPSPILSKKSEILEELFYKNEYDETVLPHPTSENGTGPLRVSVGLSFRSVENLDDVKMQYSTQILFWQEWTDSRLSYEHLITEDGIRNYILLPSKSIYEIWTPDIFFSNEKTGHLHHLIVPNSFTRIYKDGRILQSFRISLILACDMDLHSYPLDVQDCPLSIETYGWTTNDLILEWRKSHAIVVPGRFSTSRFRLVEIYEAPCESKSPNGIYSCLTLRIKFAREFGYYLIQTYLPCSMLVLVSWVSFFLEPSAVEARLSLGVTTILAVVTQTYGINQSAPPSSYGKALDVWTAWCQAMVFGALLEFACINYLSHKQKMKANAMTETDKDQLELEEIQVKEEQLIWKTMTRAKKIDKASRIIFPVVFALFNLVYWWTYL